MTNNLQNDLQSDFLNKFDIENGILKSYMGRETIITVPEHVHTIGEGAFKACISLEKVILPSGLCRILSGAFKGCRKLQKIEIPSSVSYVGDYAFHRCHSLETISLPPSVKSLGDCVFLYCDSLTQVWIPGVEHLGKQVFVNDVLLKKLEISPQLQENDICDVFTGCSRISEISFSDGQQFIIPNAVEAITGDMELPSLIRTIAVDILRMMELDGRCLVKFLTNLKHVDIPEGIQRVGKSSFFDRRGIISVTFPSSLKEIESRAFRNCISLEKITFQEEQMIIQEDAFKNCSSLKEVCMPDGTSYIIEGISNLSEESIPPLVKTIQKQVLGNFRISGSILLNYLGSEPRVAIPKGITSIAEEAFAGNEAIDRVLLPDSLEEIGAGAFRDCLTLQTIEFPEQLRYIGPGAFENCLKLLRALLPEKIVKIEDKTFKHCHALKEVILRAHVHEIREQTFYGCSSLKEIHFPDSLASIGEMAFYRCNALKEVSLLPGLEYVGNLAFAQSGVKKAVLKANGRQYGTDIFFSCLNLRTMILEQGVCHIPDKLAYGCTALKHVILPDTLESVGRNVWEYTPFLENWNQKRKAEEHIPVQSSEISPKMNSRQDIFVKDRLIQEKDEGFDKNSDSATKDLGVIFWDGRGIKGEFYLPEQTKIIAGGAFYGNTSLTVIHFSEHVTWIGAAALKGCTALCHVTWPSSITTAEPEIFSGCVNLETVECPNLFSRSPVLWQSIKKRAFYHCRNIHNLSLKNVHTIEKEALSGCISFVPGQANSLQYVGERAFEDVKLTENIKKSSYLTVIGSIVVSGEDCVGEVQLPEGITAIAPFAFSRNSQITKLILPDSLSQIGDGAFWGCSRLAEIHIPSASCVIGAHAFEKCTALLNICIHATDIGPAAFAYCLSLKRVALSGVSVLEHRLFEGCIELEECFCEHASVIKNHCFCGCEKLESFGFEFIEEIGSYAFQNCNSLKQITLYEHTILRPHAFEDCGLLESIHLAGEQNNIHLCEYALSGCTALHQITRQGQLWELQTYTDILSETIPEIVRLLFHSAFSCFEIRNEETLCAYRGYGKIIKIPLGIKSIRAEVFRDILMLKQVSIPKTVEYIGARAFHGTAWIENQRKLSPMVVVNHMLLDGSSCIGDITIPKDIWLVCGWAFAGGMGIEKIRFLSDRIRVEAYAFRNCIYLKELVLADGSLIVFHGISDRKKELPPLAMQAAMDSLNCFKTNEEDVLVECTGNISRLLVADGITAIGDNVFQDGNLLTEITLPLTVTSIGKNSFAGCKWLKAVYHAKGVTSIDSRAFSGCGALEEIELSENLCRIGVKAFENCTSLKDILLPEGVEEIPDKAFFRCHSLQKVHFPSTLKRIGKEAFAFCQSLEMPFIPDRIFVEERAFIGIRESIKE